ncbi:MAG: VWA domain-containing protein [Alphaproteobacteria bacterium]|nr:VWA domain-containing protein [Alphaproteobacteria bacterium]MDX5367779.1 VWA domain-containing protein [Alphaproteobacteria bacterium]MDX5462662.1 VWA domain-containing protein [Alphaproteobacteria bacterium]
MVDRKTRQGGPVTPQAEGTRAPRAADEVASFLAKVRSAPPPVPDGQRGRLVFAMDATMSRAPTWDRAMAIQADMFQEAGRVGGLDIQLVFFRGHGECRSSKWVRRSADLLGLMTAVQVRGGLTQIGKVLSHTLRETQKERVNALVYIGDMCEEDPDPLCATAAQLGLRGVKAFMFHEGGNPAAAQTFREIARLTGGAYAPFDLGAADQLRELLTAVAVYAAGGRRALADYGKRTGGDVLRIAHQLR